MSIELYGTLNIALNNCQEKFASKQELQKYPNYYKEVDERSYSLFPKLHVLFMLSVRLRTHVQNSNMDKK